MLTEYKFYINDIESAPLYSDDLTKETQLVEGQVFKRSYLRGSLKIIGADYEYFMKQRFDTAFNLKITYFDGTTTSIFWQGVFYKTDCDINEDDKIITIKSLEPVDGYTNVLSKLNKEFDLIKLSPLKTRVNIIKRPMVQVYLPGDDVISCFVGGTYWEQSVLTAESDEKVLINKYHFAKASQYNRVSITSANMDEYYVADYVLKGVFSTGKQQIVKGQHCYIKYIPIGDVSLAGQQYKMQLIKNNNVVLFESNIHASRVTYPTGSIITLNAVDNSVSGTVELFWFEFNIYMRYILDNENILNLKAHRITTDDITNSKNYKYVIGYAMDLVSISTTLVDTPTEYGLSDTNRYFSEPYDITGTKYFPIARSTWGLSSVWFNFGVFYDLVEEKAFKQYTLKDAIELNNVISVLLQNIDSSITHVGNNAYSEFLYGDINPISFEPIRFAITQKSNILAGEYDMPAQKAIITLGYVLDMLKTVFKCYWHIEDNKLCIEHKSYYDNGKTYFGTTSDFVDLTSIFNKKNKKAYSLYTNKYSFDKQSLTNTYKFSWMEDTTLPFGGQQLECVSNFVELGKQDEITVSNFNADIDYMLLSPEQFSKDGFTLLSMLKDQDNMYYVPFYKHNEMLIQNGYLSWFYIIKHYWLYDMPSKINMFDGNTVIAHSSIKSKKQQVEIASLQDINPMYLVKTELGLGMIEKITLNLSTRMNKIQLAYDTE